MKPKQTLETPPFRSWKLFSKSSEQD